MSDLNRRQFIASMSNLAVGGFALMYGCSRDFTAPPQSQDGDLPTEPATNIALYKTRDRTEGVKKVLELLDFPTVQGKHVVLKPNFNTADPAPASTDNDTLRQLVLELQGRGASAITIGERSSRALRTSSRKRGSTIWPQILASISSISKRTTRRCSIEMISIGTPGSMFPGPSPRPSISFPPVV